MVSLHGLEGLGSRTLAGSFPLPVTVLKGGGLLKGVLLTSINHCGNSYCKGE